MRIVILKFGAIGDMVFASPLVRALRPHASQLGIVTLPWSRQVFEHHPLVDRLHLYDPWGALGPAKVRLAAQIMGDLRREKYDAAVILHRSPFAPLLALGGRIPRRVGFHQRFSRLLLTSAVPFDPEQHEVRRNVSLLAGLGLPVPEEPRTEMHPEPDVRIDPFLQKGNVPLVGLFPGGGVNPGMEFAWKRWPVAHFITLAKELRERGYRLALFGGPDDAEMCRTVQNAVDGAAYWGVGRSLAELAALVRRCDLFVGGDSGPLHIAAAAGTPTLSLFGPTDPGLVAPLGAEHRVLQLGLECSPCYRLSPPDGCLHDHRCLRELEPETVLQAVLEMTGGGRDESERADEVGRTPCGPLGRESGPSLVEAPR